MDPIEETFRTDWPEARVSHVLDDSLTTDFFREKRVTGSIIQRFRKLGSYCAESGADAILFTCSTFGPAIEAVKRDQSIPVLKPNEALCDELMKQPGRIALLGTFGGSLPSLMAEVEACAKDENARPRIDTYVVEGAFDALFNNNRAEEHNRLVAECVAKFADYDVIAFSQFSMTRALKAAQAFARNPILTTPNTAVKKLKALMA